ncbi:MAG: tetratricopeptide repeat protein [Bacteroidota bacterium]
MPNLSFSFFKSLLTSILSYLKKSSLLVLFFFSAAIYSQENQIDSLRIELENETKDSIIVAKTIKLSREIHKSEHNKKKEYKYAQDAVDLALTLNDTLLYAKALDNFGLLHRYHKEYEEALSLHAKAFHLVEAKNTKPIYKMIFANNAGVAARYHQKYATAVDYYMKALKIAEQEDDQKNIAISSNGIGNALGQMPKREDEAIVYFKRSLEAEKKRNNQLGVAMNYLSIGDYYINQEDFKTAKEYLTKLIRLNKERDDLFGIAISYEFMGVAFLRENKDLEKAISYFEKSFEHFQTLNNEHKQAAILNHLGKVYFKKNNLNLAENYFQQSINRAKELNQLGLIEANAHMLSEVNEKKGNHKAALSFYKTAKKYEDSIEINEQNIKIEALTKKYNLEKKENHIQLLEKDKALQQALLESQKKQLERRQTIMLFLALALIFILIIFILQYRNYQIRKKTNARLNKEEKEKMNAIYERNLAQAEVLVTRLRVNPHFLFNSLNAITYLIQSEQNAKAIKYLKIFSRYTRMVLETSTQHVIPLSEELKLANYYLMLEENRFEEDFMFSISGDNQQEINEINIPPLLLQPFLENAIWHGLLLSKRNEKKLTICVEIEKNQTKVIIDDNGVGRGFKTNKNKKKEHKSMGVNIIKERIKLYNKSFSGKIDYAIIDKKDEDGNSLGTRILLTIAKK